MLRALGRFFRTPPRALRIVLGFALAVEALGFVYGIGSVGSAVRDALQAGSAADVAATLLFAAGVCAVHLVFAALCVGAALLARRAPWLAGVFALVPVALAWLGFRAPVVGFAVATQHVRLAQDTPLTLLEGVGLHVALAALACLIVLVALPFGLIRRPGAEGGGSMSNGEVS